MSAIESLKWWGWGAADHRAEVSPAARAALAGELGTDPAAGSEPVPLDRVELPDARPLPDAVASAASDVRTDAEARVRRAAGRSYPDLVRLRSGRLEHAPDAVS